MVWILYWKKEIEILFFTWKIILIMEKIFWKKSVNFGIKTNKSFCFNLPFGMLSFSSYVDIESMNIIPLEVDINEYKL